MAIRRGKAFDNEIIKSEICKLIDDHIGVYNYSVARIAVPDQAISVKITIDMYLNEEKEKIII
jgi:hypothetical protein